VAYPIDVLTAAPAVHDEHVPPTGDTQAVLAAVLADLMGVERVPVDSDFFQDLGADSMVMARFCARVRKRADLPSISMKDVYQHPTIAALATALSPAASAPAPASTEAAFAEVLAEVLEVDRVPVDSHFFDDLGADSMVMARFCARVRKRLDLPTVSIKDVYAHPTIAGLATALGPALPAPVQTAVPAPAPAPRPASAAEYVLCGALQLLFYIASTYLGTMVAIWAYTWIAEGTGYVQLYLRSALAAGMFFVAACALPVLLKWLLIGRWKTQQIRIWSAGYIRFWLVKMVINASPLRLFVGSPLYVFYLRALGAKIGRDVLILSPHLPVCTDLLTIGDGSVIRKDCYFTCYRAEGGVIQTGSVTLGKHVLVSEATVLDIDTSMGDGAQLGHQSSLHARQAVPAHGRWHGSPAQPAEVDYGMAGPTAPPGSLRTAAYVTAQLAMALLVHLPLTVIGMQVLLALPPFERLLASTAFDYANLSFYLDAMLISAVVFFGGLAVRLAIVLTVPRLLNRFIEPDRAYPLYGLHYSVHRTIGRMSNSKFLTALFGDSSYIVPYLRWLGYQLTPVVQTGSNFGTEVKHENPFTVSVGTNTVCASELSIVNAEYSSTSFRVTRASIGTNNFLGNLIAFPAGAKTGDNVLLATKVLVPVDGHVREGVGLLGSPSFEIPRMVERDSRFARLATPEEIARRLPAKNRHNAATIGLLLLTRWVFALGVTLLGFTAADFYAAYGATAVGLTTFVLLLFTVAYGALVERAATMFKPLQPKYCSIYDIEFWREERFYKLEAQMPPVFDGTPFKSLIWRMLGVRVGRRLFDDGANMAEKNLVSLGDEVTLNAGVWLQCHSQEDYAFKSGHITIGNGCTVGVGTMTLYNVAMQDHSTLAPDSFLMKGEEVPTGERWGGNPAREMADVPAPVQSRRSGHDTGLALKRTAVPAPPVGRHRADERRPAVLGAVAMADGGLR
jgi:non-ribosomal peptide synthetase-like protein